MGRTTPVVVVDIEPLGDVVEPGVGLTAHHTPRGGEAYTGLVRDLGILRNEPDTTDMRIIQGWIFLCAGSSLLLLVQLLLVRCRVVDVGHAVQHLHSVRL